MSTSLPENPNVLSDSAKEVKEFFNRYFTEKISFPAAEVDAVIAFFRKRGFEEISAQSVAVVLLTQAKLDGVKIFELLDTLKGVDNVALEKVVTQVLNATRSSTSTLGYRVSPEGQTLETRNILP